MTRAPLANSFADASRSGRAWERRLLTLLGEIFPSAEDKTGAVAEQLGGAADFVVYTHRGAPLTFEAKARATEYADVAFETWSDYLVRRGWLYTSSADWLVYGFPSGRCVLAPLPRVRTWALTEDPSHGTVIEAFPLRHQRLRQQANDTVFHVVPIETLIVHCGAIDCPREIDLRAELVHLAAS